MQKIALAAAVMLASMLSISAQADAHGLKRHGYTPHAFHHSYKKQKLYKAKKRTRAMKRYRHRQAIKRGLSKRYFAKPHRRGKSAYYARRYR